MNFCHLKLITFDVTGTVLQFKVPIGKLYCDAGALFGVKCNEDQMKRNFKKEWRSMGQSHPNFGQKDIGWKKWWSTLVHNCFKDFNVDENKSKQIGNYLIDNFQTMEYWKISKGALELLNYLYCKPICRGVISNYDERLETILCNAKLLHYFNFVIYSYGVGIQKPDVNIFKLAICKSKLSNVQPNECLHIGDNLELDYISAKNAGWNAMLISKDNFTDLKIKCNKITKDEVFKDFAEVSKKIIKSL